MYFKVIILGAGPAGLQSGYFLKKMGIDYVILERNSSPGSFFSKFPISGKLISLNKVYTGSDNPNINLRYDWNSLLNDEGLLFKQFSEEFYPNTDSLQQYLYEFSKQLNIVYNCNVINVSKIDGHYTLIDSEMKEYICKKLIVASGLTPLKTIHPHYGELSRSYFEDKDKFKNKNILIIGTGNSGFELANLLTPYAATIHLFGRSLKLASNTHYAGHLRTNYLDFIDTGMLKLQNFMYIDSIENNLNDSDFVYIIDEKNRTGKYHYTFEKGPHVLKEFDYLFMCTGFEFNDKIFNFPINRDKSSKFPHVNELYESINNKDLYFAGALMHGLDFGKSPGGFIHGFRYNIKYMITQVFSKNRQIMFYNLNEVINLAFDRLTSESGLIVMFDQFCDYIEKVHSGYLYIPFVNKQWVHKRLNHVFKDEEGVERIERCQVIEGVDGMEGMERMEGMEGITISYKFGVPLFDVFKERRGSVNDDIPGFIHPVVTSFSGDEHHCFEDDVLNFTKPIHKMKLREIINRILK